jgi:Kef-type K+ transport system membrane component KefB/mannitol/fructose-specific phosphotransferase system IIA component (Ntr-type)/nucleotide-binding universal stress UspA family protein
MPALAQVSWSLPLTHPVLVFAVLMLVILIAPLIAQRLRGPGMIGLILAGVLVGPHALNILERSEAINLLGRVGLLYIMFIAGISIDLHQFKKYRAHSITLGSCSFFIPQCLGIIPAALILGMDWPAAILLGSMFGSHTLLTYPIINRLGLSKHPAVTATVGGTMITDTCALLVLAIIAASTRGELSAGFWLTLAGSLSVYVALVWFALPRLGRWFFNTIPSEGIAHFVFVMAMVYTTAYLAEVAGVQPIIGAFLAGLALNRLIPEQSVMMSRIEFAGNWFFIPIFLISVGMLVDPAVLLASPRAWIASGVMVVTVTATKFAAAVLASRSLGFSRLESRVVFGMSVNQAAATLAAVMVGYRLGFFDESILNGTIVMILVTCLIGSWTTQRCGRRLAQLSAEHADENPETPPRILIPIRNPQGAEAILDVAFMIMPRDSAEPIYPLSIVQDTDDASERLAATERMLGSAVMHAAGAAIPVVPAIRIDTNAADGIARAARELRISTVVMGWTGSGSARNRIFGTVLDQLLQRCPQQFVVCRFAGPVHTAERLVLAVPPFAHREVGFVQAIRAIKLIAQRAGLSLAISAAAPDLDDLVERINAVKPEVPTEPLPVSAVEDWLTPPAGALGPHDLFVLLAARQHQPSWRPALDRIPQQIASLPTPVGMLVVYPSEAAEERAVVLARRETDRAADSGLFAERRTAVRVRGDDLAAVLDRVLAREFVSGPRLVESQRRMLLNTARSTPIELVPGVILLHAHTDHVDRALAFIATVDQPVRFDAKGRTATIVIVLLSPRSLPASAHLNNLASIARLFYEPAEVERIRRAESVAEVMDALTARRD